MRKQFTGLREPDALVERLARQHVNFVDSPRLFRDLKPTVEPLYPRGYTLELLCVLSRVHEALKKINACSSLHIPVPELEEVD